MDLKHFDPEFVREPVPGRGVYEVIFLLSFDCPHLQCVLLTDAITFPLHRTMFFLLLIILHMKYNVYIKV